MKRSSDNSTGAFGLLADGSSPPWDVAIDESLHREGEWSAQVEGPQVSLTFRLRDLGVICQALKFLQDHLDGAGNQAPRRWSEKDDTLALGEFGTAPVSLRWDAEEPRCFLVIGPAARSTMHWTIAGEDVRRLVEALGQVSEDLASSSAG